MKVTDQPGRWIAILLVAPALGISGYRLTVDCKMNDQIGRFLMILAVVFLVYELFWITKASKFACL